MERSWKAERHGRGGAGRATPSVVSLGGLVGDDEQLVHVAVDSRTQVMVETNDLEAAVADCSGRHSELGGECPVARSSPSTLGVSVVQIRGEPTDGFGKRKYLFPSIIVVGVNHAPPSAARAATVPDPYWQIAVKMSGLNAPAPVSSVTRQLTGLEGPVTFLYAKET